MKKPKTEFSANNPELNPNVPEEQAIIAAWMALGLPIEFHSEACLGWTFIHDPQEPGWRKYLLGNSYDHLRFRLAK